MNKKLKITVLASFLFSLIVPAVKAQFFYNYGAGFTQFLNNIFSVFRPLGAGVSPYDKLISFFLIFTLLTATFMLSLKNAFGEMNRQIKAIAVSFSLLVSYAIVAGTNFSIRNYGALALGILAIVVFFFIYTLINKMIESKFLSFLLALILTLLLIYLVGVGFERSNMFGGDLFDGFGFGGSQRDSYETPSDEEGFFGRTWGRVSSWWSGDSAGQPVRSTDEEDTIKCEPTTTDKIRSVWNSVWSGEGDPEIEKLRKIKDKCEEELNEVKREIDGECTEACEDEDSSECEQCLQERQGKIIDAEQKYKNALFNFLSTLAQMQMKNGDVSGAGETMDRLQQETEGNLEILPGIADEDNSLSEYLQGKIEELRESGKREEADGLQEQLDAFNRRRSVSKAGPNCKQLMGEDISSLLDQYWNQARKSVTGEGEERLEQLENMARRCLQDALQEQTPESLERAFDAVYMHRSELGKKYFELGAYRQSLDQFQLVLDSVRESKSELGSGESMTRWEQDVLDDWYNLISDAYNQYLDKLDRDYANAEKDLYGDDRKKRELKEKADKLIDLKDDIEEAQETIQQGELYLPDILGELPARQQPDQQFQQPTPIEQTEQNTRVA